MNDSRHVKAAVACFFVVSELKSVSMMSFVSRGPKGAAGCRSGKLLSEKRLGSKSLEGLKDVSR